MRCSSKAVGGDVKACQTLLAVRHGLTEKTADRGPGVNINFTLPSAMTAADYAKVIEQIAGGLDA